MAFIGSPPLTIAIILIAILGTVLLLRARYGDALARRTPVTVSKGNVTTPAPKPAPAPKASSGSKGGWLIPSVIVLLVVLAVAYLWRHPEWFDLRDNTPHYSSVSTLPGARMERSIGRQQPAVCTEPQQTVTVNDKEVTWVSVPDHCRANADPNPASATYDLSCKDLSGDVHEWTDEACWFHQALGFKKKAALPDQVEATGSDTLTIHLNFTTIP